MSQPDPSLDLPSLTATTTSDPSDLPSKPLVAPLSTAPESYIYIEMERDQAAAAAAAATSSSSSTAASSTTRTGNSSSVSLGLLGNQNSLQGHPHLSPSSSPSIIDIDVMPLRFHTFLVLIVTSFIMYVVSRGLCSGSIPGNCTSTLISDDLQELLEIFERIVLILVLGEFRSYSPTVHCSNDPASTQQDDLHPLHPSSPLPCPSLSTSAVFRFFTAPIGNSCLTVWECLTAILFNLFTSLLLNLSSVTSGMGAGRVILAIVLVIGFLAPLFYCFAKTYTNIQRWKAAVILAFYLVFLIANAINQDLHVHHWTWGYIYMVLMYPQPHTKQEHSTSTSTSPNDLTATNGVGGGSSSVGCRLFGGDLSFWMRVWSEFARMVAFGIMVEGMSSYGSGRYFTSLDGEAL